jgi:hypothetical protein
MRVAYAALLRLYPAPFREVFAREMAEVFEEVRADRRARGVFEYIAFLFSEIAGTLGGAFWMWSAGFIERSRRKLVISYWVSIAAGVAITAFFQWFFYNHVGSTTVFAGGDHDMPLTVPVAFAPLLLAGGVLLLLSVFSIAFVWNMRMIGNRAGRLKPIWMPSGEARGQKKVERPGLAKLRAAPIYNLDRPR